MKRYQRQELFIGKNKQNKLNKSTVAVIGLGALGSFASELLARAGVNLILVDRDTIELVNLQRQMLFTEKDIGELKAEKAKEHLKKINSNINIKSFTVDLNFENIKTIKKVDLILDCTDNLETRFLLNEFSIKNKIPMIYGAAIRDKGTVMNIIPGKVCFNCIFNGASSNETCDTSGVLNTITSLIATIQVNEAIKIILNKDNIEKNLLFFDIWKNELLKIKINKNKDCICCTKNNFEYLYGKKSSRIIKLCGDGIYQVKTKQINKQQFNNLKNKLKKIGKIIDFDYCINFDSKITIFQDGRALVKAKDEKEAKSLYSRFVGN